MQGFGVGAFEPFDEFLGFGNELLLVVVGFLLLFAAFLAEFQVFGVVYFVIVYPSHGHFNGTGGDVVYEFTVVADDDDSLSIADIGIKGGMEVTWVKDKCINCGVCEKACRTGAIKCTGTEVTVDYSKCNNCGRCVKSCPTDAWEGKSGYIVSFGGLFGNHIYKGETILPLITDEDTLFRVTDAAIGFFEKNANPGERFRLLLQRVGEDEFRKEIQAAYKGQE